ncbi:MAG: alpha-2-macroglobulin [Legionella sp.]|nr:alpha-2-macroglobulin [Legionella sp.]
MNKQPSSTLRSRLLGHIQWEKPHWLKQMSRKATLVLLLLLMAVGMAIYWYANQPKPNAITAQITAPDITPNKETLIPNQLIFNFGLKTPNFMAKSVAPVQLIGKTVNQDIQMRPAIKGEWFWSSDSQLIFNPAEDWPAGETFKVQFAKNFFAPGTKLESHDFSFTTKPFTAKITQFKFYQDPIHAEIKRAVATIHFNFPVDPTSLEKNSALKFEGLSNQTDNTKAPKFKYTYDEHKRIAYLNSDPIEITNTARYLLLTLNNNVSSSTKSAHLESDLTKNLLIPDSSNFLKVLSTKSSILRNDKDKPEQILTIETSLGVNEPDFNRAVQVYLLPVNYPASATEKEKPNYQWQNPGEITETILSLATPLTKTSIPLVQNYSTLHSYKFAAHTPRHLYIKIDKGMRGLGGFTLSTPYQSIVAVPELPKEIRFLHKGALLALSGEKKFSVLVRGLPAVKFDFARVLPTNINQFITQTQGDFNNPLFINPSLNQQNISQIFTHIQTFDDTDLSKQQYTALDLNPYLASASNELGPHGLFLLQATGWNAVNNTSLDVKSSHLILITDLGLLVKDNNDGSHDVFVQSITEGSPLAQVKVSILGKNGLEIISAISDEQGRVHFPNLKDFVDEKEPIVYLANFNNDVSFIPFHNEGRQLNFSKFDIGGIYTTNAELHNLSAYLFSDRGLYRPGDKAHIGIIIKQAYVQPQPAGLPLQATVYDPRGNTVKVQKFILNDTGFLEMDVSTDLNALTGQYRVDLTLMKDDLPQNLLGTLSFRLAEFQPDRMKLTSELSPKPADGWIAPTGLKAKINLMNLYGAPAANRRVSAKILLTPEKVEFKQYPDYIFADPLQDPKKPAKSFTESLTDSKTNDQGNAEFDLNLNRFEQATYQLTVFSEAFEADGGRSVTAQSKALVSPLPYFVGYKTDVDLAFIKQNSTIQVHYIAINPQLTPEEITGLRIQLVSLHPVTTLVKKEDGTYQYQSIIQSSIISTNPFAVAQTGTAYTLPTQQIGDYALVLLNKEDTVLSQLKFSVVGASQTPLAKNAQLAIKLNQSEFKANQDIELQITAPYTGSGLITIERDKIYSTKWFKTQTNTSIQTIHIPADFKGNGYVNVAFIRDWASPEIFLSPLSYGLAPFVVDHSEEDIKISLKSPTIARPGEPLDIEFQTDKPGKIVVFAVDEGILLANHYKTPDPLAFFFQKNALEVTTQQTVDQILPRFILDRELSAAGGDGAEAQLDSHLNPFKRKTDLPVVFWSGIVDAKDSIQKLSYQIPDYFNGTIRVMAVAVSTNAVGSSETSSIVRGDFIINPNVPTFVAPQDEFEISASIANNVLNSGENAEVTLELTHGPELELIGDSKQTLKISEGKEQIVHYKIRANATLGETKLTIRATSGNKTSAMTSSLSLRPASALLTYVNSGHSHEDKKTVDINQNVYPQFRKVEATLSTSPMILLFGLQRYLDNFPYGCTEQLVSKALPLLAMNGQSWLKQSYDTDKLTKKINTTMQLISQRQMSNGGFSYWPGLGDNSWNSFSSVYAMHFLTLAKTQGFNVPDDLFYNGIGYLKELAGQNPKNLKDARIQAYAIYVLTSNEIVTSNYLANLLLSLQQLPIKNWEQDIMGAYIAASYKLLKSDDEANKLIGLYNYKNNNSGPDSEFFDKPAANAQYLYLVAKHFPSQIKQLGDTLLMDLIQSVNNNEINTLFSGYSSLALAAYPATSQAADVTTLSLSTTDLDNHTQIFPITSDNYQKQALAQNVKQVHFNNPKKLSYFYQLVQSGFDKSIADKPLKQGIEIYREYRDEKGKVLNEAALGSEIEVHLQIRALDAEFLNNIAIVDLLPGGFEVVKESVKAPSIDYFDVREDRVNFFGNLDSSSKEIIYKIKATNIGRYRVPAPFAQAMYNPNTIGRGVNSEITIVKPM